METNNEILRPMATLKWFAWAMAATDAKSAALRDKAIAYNLAAESQLGRPVFVVEQTEQGEKLGINPPLTADELRIFIGITDFRDIIFGEGTNV